MYGRMRLFDGDELKCIATDMFERDTLHDERREGRI